MNILIITEGGQQIGLGHITRCLSLYQALAAREHHPQFVIAGDNSVNLFLQNTQGIDAYIFDWHKPERWNQLQTRIKNSHSVIIDSYLATSGLYEQVSKITPCLIILDDTNRLPYPPGIVINWSISAHLLNYPKNPSVTYLLGPNHISLRKAFWDIPIKKINKEVKQIMITFGGDDSKNLTAPVLHFLTRKYPHIIKHVIIGSAIQNEPNLKEIKAAADAQTQLHHSLGDEGMKQIMLESDFAISSGGQTLYELARTGVPAVVVTVADNQIDNVKGWNKVGFIKTAGYWNDPQLMENIENHVAFFMNIHNRISAVEAGKKIVPQNGANLIIDTIEKWKK